MAQTRKKHKRDSELLTDLHAERLSDVLCDYEVDISDHESPWGGGYRAIYPVTSVVKCTWIL
jgi:hypothetical protein